MASAAPLKDIDEQFLQCVVCLDQLKEPTLLPCLHRYCRGCLKKIAKEKDKKIECPTCREEHDLPANGVDGFKSDFNTQNIIEFVQLQDSVKHEPMKVCANCSEKLRVASYCFRCNDFLCQSCDEHHKTSKIVKDHRPHIFSLDETEARSLTIEKLSSMKEAPRCREHPEKVSELCCTTCDNLPICIACMYGEHQGHTLKEVKSLAKIEREKLKEAMSELERLQIEFRKMQKHVEAAKGKLTRSVEEEQRKLVEELDAEKAKVRLAIENVDEELKRQQVRLMKEVEGKATSRKQDLEKEMKQLRDKYDRVCEEEIREADALYKVWKRESEEKKATLQTNFDITHEEIRRLLNSIEVQEEESLRNIGELANDFDGLMKKFEAVTTAAPNIISAKNDWTDVQCIPDIRGAIVPLMRETRQLPDLEKLSTLKVEKFSHIETTFSMAEREESVVAIEAMNQGWYINDITCNKTGVIVITGYVPLDKSHITVINQKGKMLRQDFFPTTNDWPWRYCEFLTEFNVATADQSNTLGVYDVRDGTFRQVSVDSSSPQEWRVNCMTTDPVRNRIVVGGLRSRDVLVFSKELEYLFSLKLPTRIEWPREVLALNGGNFLVCDWDGKMAYRVTRSGQKCKLSMEFSKPQTDNGDEWRPSSICKARNGLLYILWVSCRGPERGLVAQYSRNGRQLMATRSLDQKYYSRRITAVDTEEGQKLLIPTYKTGQLITYGFK